MMFTLKSNVLLALLLAFVSTEARKGGMSKGSKGKGKGETLSPTMAPDAGADSFEELSALLASGECLDLMATLPSSFGDPFTATINTCPLVGLQAVVIYALPVLVAYCCPPDLIALADEMDCDMFSPNNPDCVSDFGGTGISVRVEGGECCFPTPS